MGFWFSGLISWFSWLLGALVLLFDCLYLVVDVAGFDFYAVFICFVSCLFCFYGGLRMLCLVCMVIMYEFPFCFYL